MRTTIQPRWLASSIRDWGNVPTSESGRPSAGAVGVLALGVVVQDEQAERRSGSGGAAGGVLEHLSVAVGIAEREIGR